MSYIAASLFLGDPAQYTTSKLKEGNITIIPYDYIYAQTYYTEIEEDDFVGPLSVTVAQILFFVCGIIGAVTYTSLAYRPKPRECWVLIALNAFFVVLIGAFAISSRFEYLLSKKHFNVYTLLVLLVCFVAFPLSVSVVILLRSRNQSRKWTHFKNAIWPVILFVVITFGIAERLCQGKWGDERSESQKGIGQWVRINKDLHVLARALASLLHRDHFQDILQIYNYPRSQILSEVRQSEGSKRAT